MKRIMLFLMLSCLCAACDSTSSPALVMEEKHRSTLPVEARFHIVRYAVFEDSLAYDGKRGIYLIEDRETSRTYVGLSGIGITEVGDHTELVSNTTVSVNWKEVQDER